jgi:hypothetical protein
VVNDILAAGRWRTEKCWACKHRSHINVLEAEAGHAVLNIASHTLRGKRFATVLDSRVAKGALAKGRSSSKSLQRVCRKAGVLQVAADLYPGWVFGPTRLNVADDPTRDADLRGRALLSFLASFDIHDLQKIHNVALSKPVANFVRLVLLILIFRVGDQSSLKLEFLDLWKSIGRAMK